MRLLAAALPEAQLSVGADPRQLIAYARGVDQAIIKTAVEQMESENCSTTSACWRSIPCRSRMPPR